MARGDDIQERLINFAVLIIKLCSELPKTPAGRHVAGQLLRCGTSPAPNYSEARGAESNNDFVHKLRVVLKELNESKVWLVIIHRSELLPFQRVEYEIQECDELGKIIGASIKTATQRQA
ncbi:MAG: four helix bundle protein [Calditrichaceae bacterium]|nr:four helix bundle protein [Calditrichia bacterium]NUQ40405.1 four helix bundle protein [Calditrichaceae bacterium]